MIHVLHGFLGGTEDFTFLKGQEDVVCHNLYQTEPESIRINPEDILIGYSMGGRIAMELARKGGFKLKKLVLINSHPGLSSEEEKEKRKSFELEVLSKLESPDFLSFWNSLPIFSGDRPLEELSEKKRAASGKLFEEMRLSRQDNHLPLLTQNSAQVLYIAGLRDMRYSTLARETLAPAGINCRYIDGGHRLFQHPESLMKVLTEEGIL